MIDLGNIQIADLWLGGVQAKSVYLGGVKIWGGDSPTPPGPTPEWLCFTAEQANSTVQLNKNGSPSAIYLETSTDGSTWTDYSWSGNTGDTLTLANVGDKVYMRAKNENNAFGSSTSNYHKFVMSGKIAASGNIQTLLKADGSRTDVSDFCYFSMFRDCSSLTQAPELPATTLASSCYRNMFRDCLSLTQAPELPATTLVQFCYNYMFNGCSALNQVKVHFTAWTNNTDSWLVSVANSGTFTCPAELPDTRGTSNIPVGWTKVDAA